MKPHLAVIAALGVSLLTAVAARLDARTSPSSSSLPSSDPPDRPAVGIVAGIVRLEVRAEAPPPMLSPYARRRYRPPGPSPAAASASDVVVYLIPDRPGRAAPTDSRATISQSALAIVPRVTVVQAGSRVDFPNHDEVFHNLFSLSEPHPFNLGRYPPGESRSETFDEAGVLHVFCDIHSEMSGVILVVDTPYFVRPDESGRYSIAGVPEGRHRVVAWHEAAGADTMTVVVTSSGAARADFLLPR